MASNYAVPVISFVMFVLDTVGTVEVVPSENVHLTNLYPLLGVAVNVDDPFKDTVVGLAFAVPMAACPEATTAFI